MLAAIPDAIVAVSADGHIVYLNDKAVVQFGWGRSELLGQLIDVLVPAWAMEVDSQTRTGHLANPSSALTASIQLLARRYDGSEFPAEVSFSAADAGSDRWILASIRDVTKSRQYARDLESARAEAVLAEEAKDSFLSRMSHELRTPLNAVLGFAQLLAIDKLTSDQEESVQQIVRAGQHLLAMINKVLDISEVSRGAMFLAMEPVAVRELVDEAVGMIRPLADRRELRVSFELSPDTYVFADRLRLKEAVVNLLANAVKYNRVGGSIRIDGEVITEGSFRLSVRDSGIGIAAADLPRLFTPFERLEPTSDTEGSGLGLALTRMLIIAMNGEVGVTSEVGIGSSFWIDLPSSVAEPTSGIDGGTERPYARAVNTVLYVEDNPSNVTLVERIMTLRPTVRLIVATRGQLGIDLALEHRPNLVLLDLGLPDMPGDEVVRQLRADPRTTATPIVVISGDAMPHRARELLALGASSFVTKPYDMEQLLGIIDSATLVGTPDNNTEPTPDAGGESAPNSSA